MRILGLDIGGANLKAAHSDGVARTVPFELWKAPSKLHRAIRKLTKPSAKFDRICITMTGELCDCYTTKQEGVNSILDEVLKCFPEEKVFVWLVDEEFQSVSRARAMHHRTAASNWHVLASYCGTLCPAGETLLVDMGSTTTDIIPIFNGKPVPRGKNDVERLKTNELVYAGMGRTPSFGFFHETGICREYFSSMLDVFLVLDDIPEEENLLVTADGRPATKRFAFNRLARQFGGDFETVAEAEILYLAKRIRFDFKREIETAIWRIVYPRKRKQRRVFVSGTGEFLIQEILNGLPESDKLHGVRVTNLLQKFNEEVSQAACAFALVRMMENQTRGVAP